MFSTVINGCYVNYENVDFVSVRGEAVEAPSAESFPSTSVTRVEVDHLVLFDFPRGHTIADGALGGEAKATEEANPLHPERSILRLTDHVAAAERGARGGAGALTFPSAIPTEGLQSLRIHLQYRIIQGTGADGMAIVLHGKGEGALPSGVGGGLGASESGLAPMVSVRLDAFSPKTGGYGELRIHSSAQHVLSGWQNQPYGIDDGNIHGVWLDYDASLGRISMYLAESATEKPAAPSVFYDGQDLASLIGDELWAGVSASFGLAVNTHEVIGFRVDASYGQVDGS